MLHALAFATPLCTLRLSLIKLAPLSSRSTIEISRSLVIRAEKYGEVILDGNQTTFEDCAHYSDFSAYGAPSTTSCFRGIYVHGTRQYILQTIEPIWFSEYAEGSGSNKYLEIYNPTPFPVDLDQYGLAIAADGADTPGTFDVWNSFAPGAQVPANGVYVICDSSADATIQASCDAQSTLPFDGNDALCIAYGTGASDHQLLDCIGDFHPSSADDRNPARHRPTLPVGPSRRALKVPRRGGRWGADTVHRRQADWSRLACNVHEAARAACRHQAHENCG